MIELTRGNLLEAPAEALVNTVNCVGYMGKGIALQFKQAFPANFKHYETACHAGDMAPGKMMIHDNGGLVNPRYIINFPTKRHWKGKSRIEDVESGLKALVADVQRLGIRSIAVPPLGCGLGGLEWRVVRPMIEQAFAGLPDVQVLLFEPAGAPEAKAMPVRTERPHMTPARALFIKLMDAYSALDYSRSLLEVQKLAYFLQEAGEPLRLNYEAGHYGPYAPNLNKVLEVMEGHFIRGYGDSQKPDAEKLSAYECGFAPFDDTRRRFDVRFYLVAILFIIFDLEVAFLFPWAVALGDIGWLGFFSMMGFLLVLTVGFVYEWRKGALDWE